MQFIEDFKQKVGKWVFLRELKNNKRLKSVCNLSNAKSIGILYDATNESQINEIKPFIDYFFKLKKEIKALGFVNDKQFSFCHSPKLQYDFFNIKDLNWYYKPQNYIIDNFIQKEYDILINLCDSSVIPIKYLVASSIARFKIGIFEENYQIYDFMISLNDDKSVVKLMSEIKHYIEMINK
ncbi:MAG: hypothetical protein CMD15_01435 [Flavobacteriales bacterium]|nr:hypothetical protein [Flavobacteriales bacterium]|tara:strand:- start:11816 stop:12358 length:543 start_codon:yes stop_codon:yes gene_type:complete